MNYYATASGFDVSEDIFEGGFLRYEAGSSPYCDLWRFDTLAKRNAFVDSGDNHVAIKLCDIKSKPHLHQQLKYMNQ